PTWYKQKTSWDCRQAPASARQWPAHAACPARDKPALIAHGLEQESHPGPEPVAPRQRPALAIADRRSTTPTLSSSSTPARRKPPHSSGPEQWLSRTVAAPVHSLLV